MDDDDSVPPMPILGHYVRGIDYEDVIAEQALQDPNYQNKIKDKLNILKNDIDTTYNRIEQNITGGNRVVATQLFGLITTLKEEVKRISELSVTNDANKERANTLLARCNNIKEEFTRLTREPVPEGGKRRRSKRYKHSKKKRTMKNKRSKRRKTRKSKKHRR